MTLIGILYFAIACLLYFDRPSPGILDSLLWPLHFIKSFLRPLP